MTSIFVALLLSLFALAHADPLRRLPEVEQHDRVEFQMGRKDSARVIPTGHHGLVVVSQDANERGHPWTLTLLDVNLQNQASLPLDLPADVALTDHHVTTDDLYLLFHKKRAKVFQVVRVPLTGGTPQIHPLPTTGRNMSLREIIVVDDDIYLRAQEGKWGVLLHLTTDTWGPLEQISAPTELGKKIRLQRLSPSFGTAQVDVAVFDATGRRRTLFLLGMTDGAITSTLQIEPEEAGGNLLMAQRSLLADGTTMVLGTYAPTARATGAQGLFVARYQGAQRLSMDYHDFARFHRFFDFLPERRQRRLERKLDQGKDIKLTLSVLMHDLVQDGDRLLCIGEVFFPEYYTYTTTTTTTVNGITTTSTTTYTVFLGWQTSHAFVAALDLEGHLLWEDSFPMGDVLSPTIKEHIRVQSDGERLIMRYAYGGRIFTKVVADGVMSDMKRSEERIGSADGSRQVKASWDTDAEWWRGDSFLLWGFQKLKDEDKRKQKVFFISRIDGAG